MTNMNATHQNLQRKIGAENGVKHKDGHEALQVNTFKIQNAFDANVTQDMSKPDRSGSQLLPFIRTQT